MTRLTVQTILCLLSFPAFVGAAEAPPELCVGERIVDPAVPHRSAAEVEPGVRLANGSVVYEQTDLATAGRVVGLTMHRVYRSDMQFEGPLGRGWTGEFFQAAWRDDTTGDLLWHDAEGFLHTFVFKDDAWRAPPGVYTHATFEDNAVHLRTADGTQLDFNDCGQFVARTDRHGNSLTLEYTGEHLLSTATDDRGFTWEFIHDAEGRITRLVDHVWETDTRAPRTIDYEYDADGNLVVAKLAETQRYNDETSNRVTWAYEYDDSGRLTRVFAPNQVAGDGPPCNQFDYDEAGRVISFRDGDNDTAHQLRYTLDANGRTLVRHIDPLGVRVDYTLDAHGRTRKRAQYTGFWAVSVDAPIDHDLVLQTRSKLRSTDPDRFVTKYRYNRGHQLTRIDHPAGNCEEFSYPDPSRLARGHATTVIGSVVTLDGAEWLPGEFAGGYLRLGSGLAEHAYYEVAANTEDSLTVVAVNLAAQGWTDGAKFVVFTENPDKLASGNLLEHRRIAKDAALPDVVETFSYEPYFQQLRESTSARGHTTHYEYEFDTTGNPGDGNLVVVRSPLVEVLLPDGTTQGTTYETRYGYNEYGQLVSKIDAEGAVESRHYYDTGDELGFLESIVVDDGGLNLMEVFEYDKTGLLIRHYTPNAFESGASPDDFLTTWEVNELGQRWRELGPVVAGGQRVEVFRYFDPNGNEVRTWRSYVTDDGLTPPSPGDIHDPDSFSKSSDPMTATWVETVRTFNLANRVSSETTDAIACSPVETVGWGYEYDQRGRKTARISPLLNRTEWAYDERGLELSLTEGAGSPVEGVFETDYSANGAIAAERTPLGNESTRTYDAHGREIRIQDAGGNSVDYEQDEAGNRTLERYVDAQGNTLAETTWAYDALDRLHRRRRLAIDTEGSPIGSGTQEAFLTLDGIGAVVARTEGTGRTWSCTFDRAGRLILEVDPLGNSVTRTLDAAGNPIRIDYLDLNTSTSVIETSAWDADYNALGLAVRVRDRRNQPGFNTEIHYQYDGWGQLTEVVDASGAITRFSYDLRSRPVSRRQTDETAGILAAVDGGWDRDDRPNRFSVWSEPTGTVNLQTTMIDHDARNRITRVEHPDHSERVKNYDADSNCVLMVDETGTEVQQDFDERGMLVSRVIEPLGGTAGNTTELFEYDGLGRPVSTESFEGSELVSANAWEWNTLGCKEVHTVTVGDGSGGFLGSWTTRSDYDVHGCAESRTYSDGNGVQHLRDELSRVVATNDLLSGDPILNQAWSGPDRVVTQVSGNGVVSDFNYEAGYSGLLSRIAIQREPELLFGFDYRYDTRGLAYRERRDHEGGTGRQLRFDPIRRLAQAQIGADLAGALLDDPTSVPDFGMQRDFTYVLSGNREAVQDSTSVGTVTTQSYETSTDGMNRYLSVGGFTLGYDTASRVTEDASANVDYAYDYAGRRVMTSDAASLLGESVKAHYDAFGRRVLEDTFADGDLTLRTVLLYGSEDEVIEEIVLDGNGNEMHRVQYLHGAESIIAQRVDGEWQYMHRDAEGSLIGITDEAGRRVAVFDYLPFGEAVRIGVLYDATPDDVLNVERDIPAIGTTRIHLSQLIVDDATGHEFSISVPGEASNRYRTTYVVDQSGTTLDVNDADGLIADALDDLGTGFLLLDTRLSGGTLSWTYDPLTDTTTVVDSGAGFSPDLRGGFFFPDSNRPGWFDIVDVDPLMSWLRVRGDITGTISGTAHFRAVPPLRALFNERYLYRGFRHEAYTGAPRSSTYSSHGRSYDPRTGRWLTPVLSLDNPYGTAPQVNPGTGVHGQFETKFPSLVDQVQAPEPPDARCAQPGSEGWFE